jgi:uncharacterized protein (TIGR02001 family)
VSSSESSVSASGARARIFVSWPGLVAAAVTASASAQQGPDNLHAALTIASDSLRWGLSQVDSGNSWQASVDFELDSGFFVGGSAGNVEYATEALRERPREQRLYGYVGGVWRGEKWSASLALARNAYPGLAFSYDFDEVVTSISYRDRYFVTASRTDDLLSFGNGATHVELGAAWPTLWGLEVGGSVGRMDTYAVAGHRYTHWNVGVSKVLRRFAFDLRYYDTTQKAVTYLGAPVRNEWVASVSYALAPKTATER